MGFLNDLLNPIKHIKNAVGGVKSLAHGDIRGALDPAGVFGRSGPKGIAPAVEDDPHASVTDPEQYMGDMEDPEYGSYSDPFDVEDFYAQQDPGYAFELQQGQQTLQNAASAGPGAFSGAALKDLLKYSQGFARTGYNDAFNRHQTQQGNIFNRLASILQVGQNSAAGVGAQGTTLAGNAGQALSNAGAATGAGLVGAGNALGQGATNYWLMRQFGQGS